MWPGLFYKHLHSRARELSTSLHLSHITWHLSPVSCHVSTFAFHLSHVTCHVSIVFLCFFPPNKFVKLVDGGSFINIFGKLEILQLVNIQDIQFSTAVKCTQQLENKFCWPTIRHLIWSVMMVKFTLLGDKDYWQQQWRWKKYLWNIPVTYYIPDWFTLQKTMWALYK